jgi:cytochrome P450
MMPSWKWTIWEKLSVVSIRIRFNFNSSVNYLVFAETLRKYPSVPTLFRTTAKDYEVPNRNFTIEKGMQIFIPVYAIHHNAAFYPNPEKFDPERFTPEEIQKRPSTAYLTFGDGPRKVSISIKLETEFNNNYIFSICD